MTERKALNYSLKGLRGKRLTFLGWLVLESLMAHHSTSSHSPCEEKRRDKQLGADQDLSDGGITDTWRHMLEAGEIDDPGVLEGHCT